MRNALRNLFKDAWNVPNALTVLRLILVPVFIYLYMNDQRWPAVAVFAVASLTDLLDGKIARRYNLITNFGKLFDPLSDKLLIISAIVCFGLKGVFPWVPIILVVLKELLMLTGGMVMLRKGIVVSSVMVGKVAMCSFVAAVFLGFFHQELAAAGIPLDVILLWVSAALAMAALVVYGKQAWEQLKGKKQPA
ncbi:MAG: CDP-alcohol phosphatidyltransferase family protein [Clostridia bacterium]|nr:CDP-alcohol phosphatidyltransferase family protein [Clostridia bacterium]